MKLRSLQSRLSDILMEIDGAADMISGVSFETYIDTFYMPRPIERCIEIVSEASRHIPDELKLRHADVPWRQISEIGNFLRHEYDVIDPHIVWNVATVHFPRLRPVIVEIQTQVGDEG